MAYIQKVKNKSGTSYRAYIKQSGYKRITKTFNTKSKAEKFVNSVINNRDLIEVLSSQNNQLFISQIITEYLSNIYKGTRPKTERRRLQYWIDKIGHKKVSEVSNLMLWRRLISFHKTYLMPLRTDINQPYLQSLVMQSEPMICQSIQLVLFNH